jgi:hypothetical protein
MKKALLFVSFFAAGFNFAQDCSKIFISEYVEGWSNNKALEIYNPTSQPVDLSEYIVARFSNGANSATVNQAVQLTGIIAPYDVYVGVLDKRDENGTGQEAPVWDSLQARADGFYTPVYNIKQTFYWNGNDAIVLFKGSLGAATPTTQLSAITPALVVIDIFGKIGEGSSFASMDGWSTQFPYNTGVGEIVTEDHSLIRKPSIKKGETNVAISFFNALQEYDSIPAVTYVVNAEGDTIKNFDGSPRIFGNWFSLGTHDCACNPLSVKEVVKTEAALYPNPSSTGSFTVKATEQVDKIEVYNGLGQLVKSIATSNSIVPVSIGDIPGVYLVRINTASGTLTKRLIVK